MSLKDRDWTLFAIEAEEEAFGLSRVVEVHNALRAKVERLRLQRDALYETCYGVKYSERFKPSEPGA